MRLIPQLFKANRHNVLGEEISHIVTKGRVSYDPDRLIKMALSLEVNDHTVIIPYRDFLAPFLTVVYDDGTESSSQMGLYSVVPPNQTVSQNTRRVALDGRDLTWLVSVDVFDNGYSVASGSNVITAVESILSSMGFTRVAISPAARTLTADRSWKPGSTKLEVINDLLNSVGYYSLHTLKDGTFASSPYQSVKSASPATFYDTTEPRSRVKVVRSVKLDSITDRIVNKVVVIKDNPNATPIVVTKLNTNPLSPTSISNLGVTISKVDRDGNLLDQAAAETKALRLLEEGSMVYNRLTLVTTPDVERNPNETYRLNLVSAKGELVANGLWRVRGWDIGFTPSDGLMTHQLSNIDEPPMEVAA